jgi:hypothetical protein
MLYQFIHNTSITCWSNGSVLDLYSEGDWVRILTETPEAECTPFQTHYFSENLVAPGIWIRSQEFWPLDHRGGPKQQWG